MEQSTKHYLDDLPPEAHSVQIDGVDVRVLDEARVEVYKFRGRVQNDRERFELRSAAIARGLQVR